MPLPDEVLPDDDAGPSPGITFYCVNCGIHGSVAVSGSISFGVIGGITAGSIGMAGNLQAGLEIGMDAYAEYDKSLTLARLVHQGIPGFSIPNVITVGPEVTLDLTADFSVSAEGQLLAGITLSLPDFGANLDVFDPSRSTSHGSVPEVHRIFNATGTLTATASLGLPLGLAFGIDLLAGRYSKTIALIDTPAIEAVATLSATYQNIDGVGSSSVNGGDCDGVEWQIDVRNDLTLNVLDSRNYDLFSWVSPPLAQGCIV